MRKLVCALACLVVLLTLTACGAERIQDIVSAELGIDASSGKELSLADFHGGFPGDGTSWVALSFPDHSLLEEIRGNAAWKPFPLNETVRALVYGVKGESCSIGPYISDGNGNPVVQEIRTGYYILIDRQQEKAADLLGCPMFHVTVGLYDVDTNTLYCCMLDP